MGKFTDLLMYIQFYLKNIKLFFLKYLLHLDYVGRIESDDDVYHGYEGCYSVDDVLKHVNISNSDAILDVGCGKGLFIYYARKFNFYRIDGIEISNTWGMIAKNNANKINDKRVHIYIMDALNFEQYGNYNYFFFNNPFESSILLNIIEKIKRTCHHHKITVIYQFPFQKQCFLDAGFKIIYEKFPNVVLTFERQ